MSGDSLLAVEASASAVVSAMAVTDGCTAEAVLIEVESGAGGSISINGKNLPLSPSAVSGGLCAAVLDGSTHALVESSSGGVTCFATHLGILEAERFAQFVGEVRTGDVVIIATYGASLRAVANADVLLGTLGSLGAKEAAPLGSNGNRAYALIGVKGGGDVAALLADGGDAAGDGDGDGDGGGAFAEVKSAGSAQAVASALLRGCPKSSTSQGSTLSSSASLGSAAHASALLAAVPTSSASSVLSDSTDEFWLHIGT
eukprot:2636231-Pleurochrysis_carterae.AAC.1